MKFTLVWGESWAGSGFPVSLGGLGRGGCFRSQFWPGAFWEVFSMAPPDGGVEGAALKWGAHGRIALAGCGGGGGSHRWEGGSQMPPLPSGLSPAASAACSLRDEAKGRAGALSWRHSTHLQ